MDNITDISEAAEAKAREASAPGKFDFLARVESRDYPTEEVEMFLDERSALKAMKLAERANSEKDSEAAEALYKEAAEFAEKAKAARYVLHLEGISSEEYDKCVDEVTETFPIEYEEHVNQLTFQRTKTAIQSDERDNLFRAILWSRFIRYIVSPEGDIDEDITPEKIAAIMGRAPLRALIDVRDAVETLRMTTDWMNAIQDEDFFPKS